MSARRFCEWKYHFHSDQGVEGFTQADYWRNVDKEIGERIERAMS